MCLDFLIFGCSPPQPLLLLACNRDEFYDRPTAPLHLWQDGSGILAGRDLDGGGTWLGINTHTARVAFLTNLRARDSLQPSTLTHQRASRGELITGFLTSSTSPLAFTQSLNPNAYNGFNLIVGDLRADPRVGPTFMYTHNGTPANTPVLGWEDQSAAPVAGSGAGVEQDGTAAGQREGAAGAPPSGGGGGGGACKVPEDASSAGGCFSGVGGGQALEPGRVYGLSNGLLLQWPKVTEGVEVLQNILPEIAADRPVPWDRLFRELLGDSRRRVPPPSPPPGPQSLPTALSATPPPSNRPTDPSAAAVPEATIDKAAPMPSVAAGPAGAETVAAAAGAAAGTSRPPAGEVYGQYDTASFARELGHLTSGRFVNAVLSPYGLYGTRSQTVVVIWSDGSGEAQERYLDPQGVWREVVVRLQLPLGAGAGGQQEGQLEGQQEGRAGVGGTGKL